MERPTETTEEEKEMWLKIQEKGYILSRGMVAQAWNGHRRYEKVRKLNPQQFAELYRRNIEEGISFDDLVDALV